MLVLIFLFWDHAGLPGHLAVLLIRISLVVVKETSSLYEAYTKDDIGYAGCRLMLISAYYCEGHTDEHVPHGVCALNEHDSFLVKRVVLPHLFSMFFPP